MDESKVDVFFSSHGKKFGAERIPMMKEQLLQADDRKYSILQGTDFKDPTVMLLLSIFFGSLGVDRFLLGQTTAGVLKLLTLGACGVWTIIDWFTIMGATKDANFQKYTTLVA
jgi:TM2 domain-containing membrane protein YozV